MIPLYKQTGDKKGEIKPDDSIFGYKDNNDLIALAVRYQMASKRMAIAHTKIKSEVRGGGKKPYRQKGTGRARQGSIRNPHYIGGGVAFGPRNVRNYSIKVPKKQRRLAVYTALSNRLRDEGICALESFHIEKPNTKVLTQFLDKIGESNILFVTDNKNEYLKMSAKNLQNVKVILVNYLNVIDILKYKKICFFEKALNLVPEIFSIES